MWSPSVTWYWLYTFVQQFFPMWIFPKETEIAEYILLGVSEVKWRFLVSLSLSFSICKMVAKVLGKYFDNTLWKYTDKSGVIPTCLQCILTHKELSTYHLVDWGRLGRSSQCPREVFSCTVPGVHGGGGQQEGSSSSCLPQDKTAQVQLLSGIVGQFSPCTVSSETSRSLLEVCSDFQNNFCPLPCPRDD